MRELPEVVNKLSPKLVLPGGGNGSLADGLAIALTGRLTLPDAQACRSYARARYDWPVVAARTREAYEEALK